MQFWFVFFIQVFVLLSPIFSNNNTFRFALLTDLHIQTVDLMPDEDIQKAVNDINEQTNIDFVIVNGDVTEYGDELSMYKAKTLLDALKMPYYISFGNHDVNWQESKNANYITVFGSNKFSFTHKGVHFIGFTTAPITKSGNAYIQSADVDWIRSALRQLPKKIPIIAATHYPLVTGDVDNWCEVTSIVRKYNLQAILSGHYHRNALLSYDGLPGIVNRSVLRGNYAVGGYSIYTVSDSITVSEKLIGKPEKIWLKYAFDFKEYETSACKHKKSAALSSGFDADKN